MKTPEIRIFYSWLLANGVSADLRKLHGEPDSSNDSDEQLEAYAENYRKEWSKYEHQIINALCEALDVSFYKPVIDVACAPWIVPLSDPLIISFRNYPDQFVDVLTHELCHVLLTDNTTYSIHSTTDHHNLLDRWQKLFGETHSFNALVHIPVHALCKYIYLDVLKEPNRLSRDIDDVKEYEPYQQAWEYVTNHDYKQIIADLRADFAVLRNELK